MKNSGKSFLSMGNVIGIISMDHWMDLLQSLMKSKIRRWHYRRLFTNMIANEYLEYIHPIVY